MSQENVDKLRRAYEAFNRGDFDAAKAFAHPEIEFARAGGQQPITGAHALRAWMEPDAFEDQRFEPIDFRVYGNKVLVRQHATAQGAGSGVELALDSWSVWTFDDDGYATRCETYAQHQEAEAIKAARQRE